MIRTIWRPSWIFGIEKSADIISDPLDQLFVPSNISRDTKIHITKVRN